QLNGLTAHDGDHDGVVRLYWTDAMFQRIESVHVDGTNRQVVISSGLSMPFSIAVLDNYVYWTDLSTDLIERADRRTGADYQLVADSMPALRDIKAVSDSKRATISSPNDSASAIPPNPCA